jgi:hypothetical protein
MKQESNNAIFQTSDFPNIEGWSKLLAYHVENYVNNSFFTSLYYILKEKGIKIEEGQNVFKLPIWWLYECSSCGVRLLGIPDIKDGAHHKDFGEKCGDLLPKQKNISWKEARSKSDEGLIFGCGIPLMFMPECLLYDNAYLQIIFEALQNVDTLLETQE